MGFDDEQEFDEDFAISADEDIPEGLDGDFHDDLSDEDPDKDG